MPAIAPTCSSMPCWMHILRRSRPRPVQSVLHVETHAGRGRYDLTGPSRHARPVRPMRVSWHFWDERGAPARARPLDGPCARPGAGSLSRLAGSCRVAARSRATGWSCFEKHPTEHSRPDRGTVSPATARAGPQGRRLCRRTAPETATRRDRCSSLPIRAMRRWPTWSAERMDPARAGSMAGRDDSSSGCRFSRMSARSNSVSSWRRAGRRGVAGARWPAAGRQGHRPGRLRHCGLPHPAKRSSARPGRLQTRLANRCGRAPYERVLLGALRSPHR